MKKAKIDNKTRIKRLKELSHMLKNHHKIFKEVSFNMDTWAEIDKDEDIQNLKKGQKLDKGQGAKCASAACALGSAACYAPFNKQGLKAYVESFHKNKTVNYEYNSNGDTDETEDVEVHAYGSLTPQFEGSMGFVAGEKFFGITRDESEQLFDPSRYAYDEYENGEVTARMVAQRVDDMIKQYSS